MMEQLRTQVWDHLFKTGPQTVEQISGSLSMDSATVSLAVQHEWFSVANSVVEIATGKPE